MHFGVHVKRRPEFGSGHERPDGHDATAQGFGQCHHVRLHTLVFNREHLAGAAHARLNLVCDQHHTARSSHFAHRLEIPGGRQNDATLALNGFQDHSGGSVVQFALEGVGIAVRHVGHT